MADTAAVRQWAREQGYPVGDRGRLSPDLVQAYEAAHGGESVQASTAKRPRRSSPARSSRGRADAPPPQTTSGRGRSAAKASAAPSARTVHARTPWDWPRRGA